MNDVGEIDSGGVMQLELQGGQLIFSKASADGSEQSFTASLESIGNALEQGELNEATVERAIYQVEELIMPMLRSLSPSTELKVFASEFIPLMPLLGATLGSEVTLERIEELYRQLADHAAGSPIAWQHSISAEDIALVLLVLRETMHHGGVKSVWFREYLKA